MARLGPAFLVPFSLVMRVSLMPQPVSTYHACTWVASPARQSMCLKHMGISGKLVGATHHNRLLFVLFAGVPSCPE